MDTAKRECQFARAARLAEGLANRHAELNRISPLLGYEPYAVYGPDWEAKRMRRLAVKTGGTAGRLVAVLPEAARAHTMPWSRPHPIELEITPLVRPGQRNQITLRVLNNIDVFGASGIYERMFIYARTPISVNPLR